MMTMVMMAVMMVKGRHVKDGEPKVEGKEEQGQATRS
jgi:hypothetical protein